jgi:predicted dehydrogenase
MSEPIRIGIAGAGRIVREEHVPRFRALAGVELAGVANQTLISSVAASAELGIAKAYSSWEALVDDPAIDAVLVGTWPYLHAPIAIAALQAGKHVLTEARMAADSSTAEAMLEAAVTNPGRVAMVVPASFSLWADRAIGRVLGDGSIGRLQAVRVAWDGSSGDDPGEHWRWQRRYSGTNVMALGIVYEAMARWLGHAEWLLAETQILEPRKPGLTGAPMPTDVPDHVLVIAGFPGHVPVSIEMSARTRRGQPNIAQFAGTGGTLEVDFSKQALELRGLDGIARPVEILAGEHDEWRAERDFVAAIRGEQPVELTDFATGLRYMRFVDAVHESASSGARVNLAGG